MNSLSQWPNFKLFGITYLVGKIKFKLFFSGSIGWVSEFHELYRYKMPQVCVSCTKLMCHVLIHVKLCAFPLIESYSCTCCVRLTFNALVRCDCQLARMKNSWGSIQKGLTFVRGMCWLSWHFNLWYFKMSYCRRRGNVNLDGVASSKRSLFWMVAVIAAACSVLHERAAFVSALGRFARTLVQLVFMLGLRIAPVSHFMWRVWRMETSGSMTCWVLFCVQVYEVSQLALEHVEMVPYAILKIVDVMLITRQNPPKSKTRFFWLYMFFFDWAHFFLGNTLDRFQYRKTQRQVQVEEQMRPAVGF